MRETTLQPTQLNPSALLGRWRDRLRRNQLGDEALVALAARGDGEAFGLLYDRYVDEVYRYIRLRVGDAPLAEDLTQDVFLSTLQALSGFRWQGQLRPWLLRIAHNRVANHWRTLGRRAREEALPEDDDGELDLAAIAEAEGVEERFALRLEGEAVLAALDGLSELQRSVIALRFGNGLSVAETAAVLGRTIPSVKNLQLAALAKFRQRLREVEP